MASREGGNYGGLKEILEALKTSLQEERQALEELDFDRILAMNQEMPPFFQQLKELIQGGDPDEEEDTTAVTFPAELRELLEEVKAMRKENLELSQQIKETLAQELKKVDRGEKTLRAYQAPSQGETSGSTFLKKKV